MAETKPLSTDAKNHPEGAGKESFLPCGLPTDRTNPDSIEKILQNIIVLALHKLHAENGYILLKSDSGELQSAAKISLEAQHDSPLTFSAAVVENTIKTACTIHVRNAMNNPEFFGDPAFQRFNIFAAICLPLKSGNTVIGAIYLDTTDSGRHWIVNELELLDSIASCTALTIENAQLNQRLKKVEKLAESGMALLNISHSVKNVLQMIMGASEVIDFGLKTNQIHRVIRSWEILKPNIERIRKFTLDMLDYSKERKLELGPCDFNRIIQSAIESLNAQLKQKKTKLNIRIDQSIPTITLDGERIHEMALNLILNAVDIVNQDTGIVTVETKYLSDKKSVELSVSDNGPGMTDEIMKKIFTPFESTKNKFGTGLGMAIAKRIIDQHKGCVRIDTQLGKGSAFKVTLPAELSA